MNKKLLLTFGCSWTYGAAAGYKEGMSEREFHTVLNNTKFADMYAFRSCLARKYGFVNKNFAERKSSNQRQFRYAKEYFGSEQFVKDSEEYESIVVFHAITSTARNEFFNLETNKLENIKYDVKDRFQEFMLKFSYDHDHEVKQLTTEMNFWNLFYKSVNIKNIWADTFNHHDYPSKIDNLLGQDMPARDIMSLMALHNGFVGEPKKYQFSSVTNMCDMMDYLVKNKLLNPVSKHPTAKGHHEIAKIISSMMPLDK